jgi:cobalt/nickel transport system permease protein
MRFGKLDPRCRLLAVLAAAVLIVTTPAREGQRFYYYAFLIVTLCVVSGAPLMRVLRRSLAAAPFLVVAAGMLVVREGWTEEAARTAASVVLKGWFVAWMLALFAATTTLAELLWAMQRLGAPESFGMMLALMSRYIGLFTEEYRRMARARESRTARPLGRRVWAVHSRQLGALVLRAWDRAERIHAAMVSRGFERSWPVRAKYSFAGGDAVALAVVIAAFGAARLAG